MSTQIARPQGSPWRRVCFWLVAGMLMADGAARGQQVGTVFVIDFENQDWSDPAADQSSYPPVYGPTAAASYAPYINSLVTPGNANATYVSYASQYHNALASPAGANPSIHPSEPNYIWEEAGTNYNTSTATGTNAGVNTDNDPYGSGGTVATIQSLQSANPGFSTKHLCGLLQSAGIAWKSYQEDIDILTTGGGNGNLGGTLTSGTVPASMYTVPLSSFSGNGGSYVNTYNKSSYWGFACKHNGPLFFPDTNGGDVTGATNTEASHYAPLQQLFADLANNTVARYNLITPDLYNDMHNAIPGGFTYNGTMFTDARENVAQGDNFLSIVIPKIMASQAWQNNGVIIIWTDESEGTSPDDFTHSLTEIVISKLAKGNGCQSVLNYTHSSDLATMQEIFQVTAGTGTGYLNDAGNSSNPSLNSQGGGAARDLADLFQPGVIPVNPSPPPLAAVTAGATALTASSAMLNGTFTPNGTAAGGWVEYGPTVAYGNTTRQTGTDNAESYTGFDYSPDNNGGSGLGPATYLAGTGGGLYLADAASGGRQIDGNNSFGVYAGSGTQAFDRAILNPGGNGVYMVSARFDVNNSVGFSGFNLKAVHGNSFGTGELISFGMNLATGNNGIYVKGASAQTLNLGSETRGAIVDFILYYDAGGSYTLGAKFRNSAGYTYVSGTLEGTGSQGAYLGFENLNTGNTQNFIFDNLSIQTSSSVGAGNAAAPLSYTWSGLAPGTTYHYRAAGMDAAGEAAGADTAFTTLTLLQQWRENYFGTTNANDPVGGDTAEPLGDGVPNLLKYALGINPVVTMNRAVLPAGVVSGSTLALVFTRVRTATDVTYHVDGSSDLVHWSEIWTSATVPYSGAGATEQVTVPDVVAMSPAEPRFLRLRVTDP